MINWILKKRDHYRVYGYDWGVFKSQAVVFFIGFAVGWLTAILVLVGILR